MKTLADKLKDVPTTDPRIAALIAETGKLFDKLSDEDQELVIREMRALLGKAS